MRKTTCSSEPGGIVRTRTVSKSRKLRPPEWTVRGQGSGNRGQGSTDAEISLNGSTTISWSAAAARARSRAYQESGEARTAKRKARVQGSGFRVQNQNSLLALQRECRVVDARFVVDDDAAAGG